MLCTPPLTTVTPRALRVLELRQLLSSNDLSSRAADYGAWAACVLTNGTPPPPLAVVRLPVCVRVTLHTVSLGAMRGVPHAQVVSLLPSLGAVFDTCTVASKALLCSVLVLATTERLGVQVRGPMSAGSRGGRQLGMLTSAPRAQALLAAGLVPRLIGLLQSPDQALEVSGIAQAAYRQQR